MPGKIGEVIVCPKALSDSQRLEIESYLENKWITSGTTYHGAPFANKLLISNIEPIVEDIVDTGITLNYILNHLRVKGPASLAVCTLLDRRVRRILDVSLDYVGFEVPDEFVVGYGLDSREEYRNLPFSAIPTIGEKPEDELGQQKDKTDAKNTA